MQIIDTLKYKKMKYDRKKKAERAQAVLALIVLCAVLLFIALIAALFSDDSTDEPKTKTTSAQVVKQAQPVSATSDEAERSAKQEQFCLQANATLTEPALTRAIAECVEMTKDATVADFDESFRLAEEMSSSN